MRLKFNYFIIGIILFQIILVGILFGFNKNAFHSDEIWNYAFSNSFDSKEIHITDSGELLTNVWRDSNELLNFISVDSNHRFSYGKVFERASSDLNPPLQLFVLHTISSFFPGVFSKWFCFIINIVSFAIISIYLYKIIVLYTKNKYLGLAAVLFCGFCVGIHNIVFFLRIYALGVAFATMFVYYSLKCFKSKTIILKNYIMLCVSCFLASYTLHLFLAFAFIITLLYSILNLLFKRFKEFFAHGFSCLIPVILSFLLFPASYMHLFNTSGAEGTTFSLVKYPFKMQVRLYMHIITKELFGLAVDKFPNPYLEYFLIAIVVSICLITPFALVFRNEEWLKNIIRWIKNKFIYIITNLKKFDYSLLVWLIAFVFMLCLDSDKTSVYGMAWYADRYMFLTYPLIIAFAVCSVYFFVNFVSENKTLAVIFVLLVAVIFSSWSQIVNNRAYFFEHEESGTTLSMLPDESNCIILTQTEWLLALMCPEIYNTSSFLLTTFSTYEDADYSEAFSDNNKVYLIMDQSLIKDDWEESDSIFVDLLEQKDDGYFYSEEILDYYYSIPDVKNIELVGKDELFTRKFKIYEIVY